MPKSDTTFKPGNPGKPKGAVNHVTQDVRDKFRQLLEGIGVAQLQEDLQAIENPKDRLQIIIGLAEFIIPKLARTALTAEDPNGGTLSVTLNLNGPRKDD